IALALKSTCEELGCYLGRYRGDEFGVLVKGGTPEDAHEVAEKLRLAVEKSRTEHKHSSVSNIVTLSIGLSTFYPTSMKTVIEQAGSALVGAKTGGRNKVLTHLEQPSEYSVVEESDLVSKSSNELSSDTVVDKARQQHNTAEQQSDFVADVLKKEEMLRKEEIKKEEALRKEELEKEALKKAEELKQEELRKEEERKREEEIIREEKARKDALGMYDYDQYF
ncbi:diguanylate cyclase, partial [Psychromonas sp.]|nr:diguanylate cyclase [Psychromonas sp.]